MSEQTNPQENICSKPDHLYKRYWCKECEKFHYRDTALGKKHKEFKLNRYYCTQCGWTHVATYGEIFEKHLKHKGTEISYYSRACSLKCNYYRRMGIKLSPEDAKLIDQIKEDMRKQGYHYNDSEERLELLAIESKYTLRERKIPYPFMLIHNFHVYNFHFGVDNQIEKIVVSEEADANLKYQIYSICKKIYLKEYPEGNEQIIERIQHHIEALEHKIQRNIFDLIDVPMKCVECGEQLGATINHMKFYPDFLDLFHLDFIPKFKHKYTCDYRITKIKELVKNS